MAFYVDRQTLHDLHIFGKGRQASVFDVFNRTHTKNGAKVLEDLFTIPPQDEKTLRQRMALIDFLMQSPYLFFDFRISDFDEIDSYLTLEEKRSRLAKNENNVGQQLHRFLGSDTVYQRIERGVQAVQHLSRSVIEFLKKQDQVTQNPASHVWQTFVEPILTILNGSEWITSLQLTWKNKLRYEQVVQLDEQYRFHYREALQALLEWLAHLDALVAIATVSQERKFVPAEIMPPSEGAVLTLENAFHPLIPAAKANSLCWENGQNMLFLTGANMAGKSTLMKTIGISVYLAHLGIPVPATAMRFRIRDGLFTTINLPDNIAAGYSHFYAEVLRIKKVAVELGRGKNLIVLFDELFRGTNVKDAYDGTLALMRAFACHSESLFVISTHITEAGEQLQDESGFVFRYMPTQMDQGKPVYTYTVQNGISEDRHGMVIIKNEKILETLAHPMRKSPGDDRCKATGSVSKTDTFQVDKQTLDDLQVAGKFRKNSLFQLYNRTKTPLGEKLMERWMLAPLKDYASIQTRSNLFKDFMHYQGNFPIQPELLAKADSYLRHPPRTNYTACLYDVLAKQAQTWLGLNKTYDAFQSAWLAAWEVLRQLRDFAHKLIKQRADDPALFLNYLPRLEVILALVDHPAIVHFLDDLVVSDIRENKSDTKRIEWRRMTQGHYLLQSVHSDTFSQVRSWIAELDVLLGVRDFIQGYGEGECCFANVTPKDTGILQLTDFRHPALRRSVTNSISLDSDQNVLFLTGANMAGKSTLMKAVASAVYLSHVGLPIPAKSMRISVRDGLFTSINVPDNIDQGYSHFFAEVKRVRMIADKVASGGHYLILFDELFKGTNVKDAFEATLTVTGSFSRHPHSSFIISTHIIEVAPPLKEQYPAIQFMYLPTQMKDNKPIYTYRLEQGVTDDRHGKLILENEQVISILSKGK